MPRKKQPYFICKHKHISYTIDNIDSLPDFNDNASFTCLRCDVFPQLKGEYLNFKEIKIIVKAIKSNFTKYLPNISDSLSLNFDSKNELLNILKNIKKPNIDDLLETYINSRSYIYEEDYNDKYNLMYKFFEKYFLKFLSEEGKILLLDDNYILNIESVI